MSEPPAGRLRSLGVPQRLILLGLALAFVSYPITVAIGWLLDRRHHLDHNDLAALWGLAGVGLFLSFLLVGVGVVAGVLRLLTDAGANSSLNVNVLLLGMFMVCAFFLLLFVSFGL